MKNEQAVRDEIKKECSAFTAADKTPIVFALAETEGESSYTELITCMEMARDVRKLHSDANSLSEQNIPSAPPLRTLIKQRRAKPPSVTRYPA